MIPKAIYDARAVPGRWIRTISFATALLVLVATSTAQKPTTHTLRAGPRTIAFGHYDPTKPAVLRIKDGDIVDVTTMLTNSPMGLERMGLAPERVQPELRAIHDSVPRS